MKKNSMIWACYALFFGVIISVQAQEKASDPWMKYDNPAQAGFSQEKLALVEAKYKTMRSAAFMVVHQGKVLLSINDVSRRYMTHSMRKSFMSAIYGIYIEKGKINLYKTLKELGIDDKLGLTDAEKGARIHDLIRARSGIYHPAAYEPKGMKSSRPKRGSKRPGESFFYNNWDFNTLLPILEQEAGIKFFDELYQQIAEPLGMEDLRASDLRYRIEPDESNYPAYLMKMSARDLARFGQLYANKGNWDGVQIIPEKWVEESTMTQSINLPGFENRGGYGYLWWTDDNTFDQPTYYASGLGGHRVYVFPQSDLVIVHQANTYLGMNTRSQNLEELINLVLDAQTGTASSNPTLSLLKVQKKKVQTVSMTSQEFAPFVGDYNHPFFGDLSISMDKGKFYATGQILGSFRIFPLSKTRFAVEDLPELPFVFEKSNAENPRGKATTRSDERGRPIEFVVYY